MNYYKSFLVFALLLPSFESIFAQYYPYLATVHNNQDMLCGSVVVHKNYLLTVGSCLNQNGDSKLYVLFGDPRKKRKSCIDEVIYLPSYQAKNNKNDLALLRLTEPLPLTDDRMEVKRIPLTNDFEFKECFTISMAHNHQQKAGIAIWSRKPVNPPYPKHNDLSLELSPFYDNETTIPILKGSPLICEGRVVGLFSSINGTLRTHRILALFTQVPIYFDWIDQHVGNSSKIGTFDTVTPNVPSDVGGPESLDAQSEVKLNDRDTVLLFIGLIIAVHVLARS